MKKLVLILCLLSGCATLESKEVFVGCRAADMATSAYAVHVGAYETSAFPFPILIGLNIAVAIYAWVHWHEMDSAGKGIANVISCAPVVNNINVIRTPTQ